MNRLVFETSPYLLQHKNNPVDWHPWDDEALNKSKSENKPILLSIGYSSCHWCHVMEKESFEDPDTAELMNRLFINIKVDREERPDIDSIYMNYVQMISGSGGWPLTVFLTPDLVPFFGGTYFPPEDKYGRPGFPKILSAVANAFKVQSDEINSKKDDILGALERMVQIPVKTSPIDREFFDKTFETIYESYDKKNGGFGGAPKFPSSMVLSFLLSYHLKTKNQTALDIVETSLFKMACGGIYDQLGGGFHRYSTDEKWIVPHFEKMLYDNALLSKLYFETYRLTSKTFYKEIGEDILNFVMNEMNDPNAGFYSAQDADSEEEEGKFFVWNYEELKEILSEKHFSVAKQFFSIDSNGNFEGNIVLTANPDIKSISKILSIDESEIRNILAEIRKTLFDIRNDRVKPLTDDKSLTNWNALMISAFCEGYKSTGKSLYLNIAEAKADFLFNKMFDGKIIFHSFKEETRKTEGFLDDYAFTAKCFLDLYELTFNEKYFNRSLILTELAINYFYNENDNSFYYTTKNRTDLIIRPKDFYDNALPGANSVILDVMLKISIFNNDKNYRKISEEILSAFSDSMMKYPLAFGYLLKVAYFNFFSSLELAVVAENSEELNSFIQALNKKFLFPFVSAGKIMNDSSAIELLDGKKMINFKTTYFICKNFSCSEPLNDLNQFLINLEID